MTTTVFGTELSRWRQLRGLSRRELGRLAHCSPEYVGYLERGGRLPSSEVTAALDAALRAGGSLLAAAAQAAVQQRLLAAARQSAQLAQWAVDEPPDTASPEVLGREIAAIARDYVHRPPLPLVERLIRVRDRIQVAMRLCQHPLRRRELYWLAAAAVQLLAELTDDLTGDSEAAMIHARAAARLAEAAGDPSLQAWVAGTAALIEEWRPAPRTALALLDDAVATAPRGQRVRLYALEARTAARAGDTGRARAAAERAVDGAQESASGTELAVGGVMSFPTAKLAFYLGDAYHGIGDHRQARRWSSAAVAGYTDGPADQRSYGDQALAQLTIALSLLATGDADDAAEVLIPVLKLPPEHRISPIMGRMGIVTAALRDRRYAGSPTAQNLDAVVTGYLAGPPVTR
ncbi:helix-turn-helix domain-containing protein [Nocardia sp. alder85J]|uniref:helix-turn-helix domain-containing protein n=1 Tax=Nocardia sp. alder85J TaxID=2862949 RepID=UPI001CD42BCC|nr:helix-turn-helix transcriptional regulator [Nocardia sp. alder85J]MCX4097744.1 helix-turn-helix transcriptional regulator [Nocardia sp. alder85J]